MRALERLAAASASAVERLYHFGAVAGKVLLLALAVTLAQSIFWADHVPAAMKLGAAGLWALSFARPAYGLLAVAALAPFGYVVGVDLFDSYPARGTEAMVLAFLAGFGLRWAARGLLRRQPRLAGPPDGGAPEASRSLVVPLVLFGAVAVASCAVHYRIVQVWQDRAWPFFVSFLDFLARAYHDDVGPPLANAGFGFVGYTIFALMGPGLLLATRALCRRDPDTAARLHRVFVIGAVAACTLTFVVLATSALRQPDPLAALPALALKRPRAMFTPKLNTAASLFVLALPLAIAGAAAPGRWRPAWIAGSVWVMLALVLNGTRGALLALLLVGAAGLVWFASRRTLPRVRGAALAIGLVVGAGILAGSGYHLFATSDRTLSALRFRLRFTETAVRMWSAQPVFGVGINQYYVNSDRFAPPDLVKMRRATAHNQFLQVAAELGLVGLATFLWMVGAALWRAFQPLRAGGKPDLLLAGALAGSVAYLITAASAGHPMLVGVTYFPFWVVLGLAAGRAALVSAPEAARQAPDRAPNPAGRTVRWQTVAIVGIGLLCLSLPMRLTQELRGIDFTQIAYGIHGWQTSLRGEPYRWSSGRSTIFVPAGSTVTMPIRARPNPQAPYADVEIGLDGLTVVRTRLEDREWRSVALIVPSDGSERPVPVSVRVTPTWRPVDVIPRSSDTRELGIMIGELTVRDLDAPETASR